MQHLRCRRSGGVFIYHILLHYNKLRLSVQQVKTSVMLLCLVGQVLQQLSVGASGGLGLVALLYILLAPGSWATVNVKPCLPTSLLFSEAYSVRL